MHQLSDQQKINIKISLVLNVANTIKNRFKNKILHNKIRSRHASNPLKYGCVTVNKIIVTLWLVYAATK